MASAEFTRQELVLQFWSELQNFLDARRHAALDAGLDTAGYELLLALKAFPKDVDPNISTMGKNLMLQHRVTAKVVKRLARQGLLSTHRGRNDRRCLALRLTAKGQRLLGQLARKSIATMAADGLPLARSLRRLRPRAHSMQGAGNWRRRRLAISA